MKTTFEGRDVPEGATHFIPEGDTYYAQWLKKEDDFKHYYKCIREDGITDPVWIRSRSLSFPSDAIEIKAKEKKEFDLKTKPWFIRVNSESESRAAQEWLFQNGMTWFVAKSEEVKQNLRNIECLVYDGSSNGFLWNDDVEEEIEMGRKEIKLSFSLKVDKVEFPTIKSEQEIQLEKLKEKIEELNKQAEKLEKVIKGGE